MRNKGRLALLSAALLCAAQPAVAHDEAADRLAIHELLIDYGRTLDARDFEGFSALFARDGNYNGTKGAEAGEMMRKVFAENAMGFREPNFHIFFNEVIKIESPDKASATSMSFYVVPSEENRPTPVLMAAYEDDIVREDGKWKFASRKVKSLIPAPPQAAPAASE